MKGKQTMNTSCHVHDTEQLQMRRRRRCAIREVCEMSPDPLRFIEEWIRDEGSKLESSACRDLKIVRIQFQMKLRENLRALNQDETRRESNRAKVHAFCNNLPPYSPAVLNNIACERDLQSEKQKAADFERWYRNERTNRVNLQNIMRRASAGEDMDPTLVYSYEAENLFKYTAKLRAALSGAKDKEMAENSDLRVRICDLVNQRTQHEARIKELQERNDNQARTIREKSTEAFAAEEFLRKQVADLQASRTFGRAEAHYIIESQKARITTLTNLLADARGQIPAPTVASDMQNIATPPAPGRPGITLDTATIRFVAGETYALWADGTCMIQRRDGVWSDVWRWSQEVQNAFRHCPGWWKFLANHPPR
jgi:hypothetical protein